MQITLAVLVVAALVIREIRAQRASERFQARYGHTPYVRRSS